MEPSGTATDVALPPASLDAFVAAATRGADIAGTAVAAFDRDGLRWATAHGWADVARGEAATVDTLFRAASVSKPVTATLVLRCVEDGAFDLDTPVVDILGDRHVVTSPDGDATPVTVRHLLTHTAGLPASTRGVSIDNRVLNWLANERRPVTGPDDAVTGLHAKYAPGERIVYSNSGYAMLGHCVATVTGRSFERAARERCFDELAMRRSDFVPHRDGPGVATGYGHVLLGGTGRRPVGRLRLVSTAMGSMYTSVVELARFGRAWLRGGELDGRRILAASTVADAARVHALNHPDLDQGFGLGFVARRWRDRDVVFHDGGMPGVSSKLWLSPDDGVGYCVLANGLAPDAVNRIGERIAETELDLAGEVAPGAPRGVAPADAAAWERCADRAAGKWAFVDFVAPPMEAMTNTLAPAVAERSGGTSIVLRSRLFGNEPAVLQPDGDVGRFRVAHPVWNGTAAVVEEAPDGLHLWFAAGPHLVRRVRR